MYLAPIEYDFCMILNCIFCIIYCCIYYVCNNLVALLKFVQYVRIKKYLFIYYDFRLFNAAVGTLFESELLKLYKIYKLVISDYNVYGRESRQYTYVSDSHFPTSWLNHLICGHDMN